MQQSLGKREFNVVNNKWRELVDEIDDLIDCA